MAKPNVNEKAKYYEGIFKVASQGIIFVDHEGIILTVNPAFEKILGYKEHEVLGKSFFALAYKNQKMMQITSHNPLSRFYQSEKGNMEMTLLHKGGHNIPVRFHAVLIRDEHNQVKQAIGVIEHLDELTGTDETGGGLAEKMWEAQQNFDNVLNNSADAILICDITGNIMTVNKAFLQMLDYTQEEVIGKHITEFTAVVEGTFVTTMGDKIIIDSEYINNTGQKSVELYEKGYVKNWETHFVRKDKVIVPIEATLSMLKDKHGDRRGSIVISRDITERKQQEEKLNKAYNEMEVSVAERTAELKDSNIQLQQQICVREEIEQKLIQAKEIAESANIAKSEFLANMSHEFRTPLNHIIGFTELVVDKNCGDLNENQEEYLGDALQSSKHLLLLVNDILDLSKVEAGKLDLEASSFDPRILIDNSLLMLKEKSYKHNIELSSDVDHIPETITADERKLKQILYNILSNAVKFTPDGGKVRLSAQLVDCIVRPGLRSGDPEGLKIITAGNGMEEGNGKQHRKCVKFSVSDTGIGIKPEDQDRIFSPFEQVEGSSSRRYEGTGLGLPLTRKFVELHGGRMWVESEGEGEGSTFSFLIPIEHYITIKTLAS